MIFYEVDPLAVAAQKQLVKGMEEAGFEIKAVAVQDDAVQHLDRPRQQAEQDAQPACRQLVLGLAVGSDHGPAAR